jgi:putative flavoprotein involved in K+ transport
MGSEAVRYATTIIIGAGHCGLAMSAHLTARSIDHVVLERGEVANAWWTERWDSLRLLTPNWQSRLPGFAYSGPDPDGYMTMPEVVNYLRDFAEISGAPIVTNTSVIKVRPAEPGYEVLTDRGIWRCRMLVIATGAATRADLPGLGVGAREDLECITTLQYRNPGQLPDGGVMIVGASASGVQVANEIQASGRDVVLAVGEHVRMPRMYRGRDILWWMDIVGMMDVRYDEIEDIRRARRLPSPQLVGSPERATLDLNSLRESGVEVVGRLVALHGGHAHFSGSLANVCALADLKMIRLLATIDKWVEANGLDSEFPEPEPCKPTLLASAPRLSLNLRGAGIRTIVWATGYRPDYSWLDAPVLDAKGRLRHEGGIVAAPGMYALGLPFMRRRKSSFIDGAGQDAADVSDHLSKKLTGALFTRHRGQIFTSMHDAI